MGIYISSKGEEKETEEMAYPYLISALRKAEREADEDTRSMNNLAVLNAELATRCKGCGCKFESDRAALSRYGHGDICPDCGTREALEGDFITK